MNPEIIPDEYASARPPHVPHLDMVDMAGGGYGACFFGEPGIGKTWAATALAYRALLNAPVKWEGGIREWRYPPNAINWTSAPYLLAQIRDTFRRKGGQTEKDIIDKCIGSHIFLLDDLGAEKQTEFAGSTLYTILSGRRNRRRYTIITTNQPLATIDEWEPRIASRMAEMVHVKLPGQDWRLKRRSVSASSKLLDKTF